MISEKLLVINKLKMKLYFQLLQKLNNWNNNMKRISMKIQEKFMMLNI